MNDESGTAPATTPLIRPGTDADLDEIAAIYAHHVRNGTASFETEAPSLTEMHRRHAELVGAAYPYLVAETAGQIAGYAYAGPYRPRPAYRDTVEDSVYLHPDAMRRGIGARLLAALVAECEARGFRQMVAVIGDSRNRASIQLHERAGFRHVGTLRSVGYKHGRWLDTVLMQRALGAGDGVPPQDRTG